MKKISCLTIIFFSFLLTNIASADYTNFVQASSFTELLGNLLSGLQSIIVLLFILMLVVAGIIYIFSGVDSNLMSTAKNMFKWAIAGFTIAVAFPSLLKEIYTVFGTNPPTSAEVINNAKGFAEIFTDTLSFLLTIVGIFALIGFVVGAIQYLISFGDKGKIDRAKKLVYGSIIAILVSGSGVIIIRQIFQFFEN